MKLMKRDKEIMRFINSVGWCTASQLQRRFNIKWWIFYRLMKRLINAELVIHKQINFEWHGIYYLTPKGARYTDLPPVERVSKGLFDHQHYLIEVVLKLCELYPEAIWVSERHLLQKKFQYGLGKSGHVSDGVFTFPDGKKISIEVELSLKSKHRLRDILNSYAGTLKYKEIWYFCGTEYVMDGVARMVGNRSFFKIYSLREFLNGQIPK